MTEGAEAQAEGAPAVTRRTMRYLGSLYVYAISAQLADGPTALDFRDFVADTFRLDEIFMAEHGDLAPLWAAYLEEIAR